MTLKTVEGEFRRMGLSESDIHRSLSGMGMLTEANEMDVDDDFEEEEDFEDPYIGDNDEDEDDLDEGMRVMRTHKSSAAERRKAKQYYRGHKSQVKRQRKKRAKTSAGKRAAAFQKKRPSKGRPHVRRVWSDVEMPTEGSMQEDLMGSLHELAESIERDPKSRFDEYVEAFNYIADLGELLALRSITEDGDEESATEVIGLSVYAEDVLREMEEMGGALTPEEDEELEALLDEGLEQVEQALEAYGLIAEDDEEEEYDEEESDEDLEDEDFEDEEELDEDDAIEATIAALEEAARTAERPMKASAKGKKRLTLQFAKPKRVGGTSKWSKIHGPGASKKQVSMRKDVRSTEALLSYLKLVKAGKVAPGQKTPASIKKARAGKGKMDKRGRYNPGAAAAKKAAGKR